MSEIISKIDFWELNIHIKIKYSPSMLLCLKVYRTAYLFSFNIEHLACESFNIHIKIKYSPSTLLCLKVYRTVCLLKWSLCHQYLKVVTNPDGGVTDIDVAVLINSNEFVILKTRSLNEIALFYYLHTIISIKDNLCNRNISNVHFNNKL